MRADKDLICPNNCSNRGRCVEGRCVCNDNSAGTACQLQVQDFKAINNRFTVLNLDGYMWFKYDVDPNSDYLLTIYNSSYETYETSYKVCISEQKETLSSDDVSCFYSTHYDKRFGPIQFYSKHT